jgi:hypothetical protein
VFEGFIENEQSIFAKKKCTKVEISLVTHSTATIIQLPLQLDFNDNFPVRFASGRQRKFRFSSVCRMPSEGIFWTGSFRATRSMPVTNI